jgi:hypothetical protein
MITHCANRVCASPFHYLRGGRLYRFDLRRPSTSCTDVPNAICSSKPAYATVFFWLCEPCSTKYSLRFNLRDGTELVPLEAPAAKVGTGPVIAVQP